MITNGVQGIQFYIERGANVSADSPGKPLSYKLCFVNDSSTAYVTMSTTYYERSCVKASGKFNVTVKHLKRTSGIGRDFYGTIWTQAFDDVGKPNGDKLTIWSTDKNNTVKLYKDARCSINQRRLVTLGNFHKVQGTAYVEVDGDLWEKDRRRSDQLKTNPKRIYLNTAVGSPQEGTLTLKGGVYTVEVAYRVEAVAE
jgi:hypothetical protein